MDRLYLLHGKNGSVKKNQYTTIAVNLIESDFSNLCSGIANQEVAALIMYPERIYGELSMLYSLGLITLSQWIDVKDIVKIAVNEVFGKDLEKI